MPFFQFPFADPGSAYLPFRWGAFIINPDPIEFARVEYFINTVSQGTFDIKPFLVDTLSQLYAFNVDVQDILQNITAPISGLTPDSLGTFNDAYTASTPDSFGQIQVLVTYYYRDPVSGILVALPIVDGSPIADFLAATRQQEEPQDFIDFQLSSFQGRFLTNAPQNSQSISLGNNAFMSFLDSGAAFMQVETFDSAGNMLETGITPTAALGPPNENDVITIGVGPANIENIVWSTGSVNINAPNVAYYTVSVGIVVGPNYIEYSQVMRFDLEKSCPDTDLRVHFLNRLGGMDSYTFRASKTYGENSSNDLAQRPKDNILIGIEPPIDETSVFKINSRAQGVYTANSQLLEVAEATFLAELITSQSVYLERPGGFVSAYTESGQYVINDSNGLVSFAVTIIESNEKVIQRQ